MIEPFEWAETKPGELGMDAERLNDAWNRLEERQTRAFLVVRNDRIGFERYAHDGAIHKKHYTASMAKAIVGSLSLMVALGDGLLNIDDPVSRFVPQWKDDPLKSRITIRHLATHTSGLENAEEGGLPHQQLTGWKGEFWKQDPNPFRVSRDKAPVLFAPGTDFDYSNPGMAMLAYAVTASLQGTSHPDIRTLLRERIFAPIGLTESDWAIGYNKTFSTDGLPLVPNWGGGDFTARAVARIGRLLLSRGKWEDTQLLDPKVVQKSLSHAGAPSPYGYGWLVNSDLAGRKLWPGLPSDAVLAAGAQDQHLLIVPSRKLIAVRNGGSLDSDGDVVSAMERHIGVPLMEAIGDLAPCPRSELIEGIDWAPASRITRMATGGVLRDGSDNWPVTWANDGHLYATYGDGYGFEPSLPSKLGLGFTRIEGMPEHITGFNIRSDAENGGYGRNGKKASGLLMTDGVLYMWVRNDRTDGTQSRLARSDDQARTWRWMDWAFEPFGHVAFVNFGQNYAGARDDYVYMVSHDHPSAYVRSDRFILMRVPKQKLEDRNAYEFWTRTDASGEPEWSADIGERGAVFTHPGQCGRSSISYHPGLRRYLWWQSYKFSEDVDTRFTGGFGIYEAPEPWGPWQTAYFTEKWDVGPGDLGCIPTKWMEPDGRTFHLLFAGDDNFSVREGTIRLRQ
ncbi:MAG: hypothetical protein K0Q59_5258 [Paenibacillus sp.]|nr:hypothetical protein [Paenibacillus sp.]